MTPTAVEFRHVSRIFTSLSGDAVRALDGVSFKVAQGEFIALSGPSGSGKSTLMAIAGAIDSGFEGSVSLFGAEVRPGDIRQGLKLRRHYMGFIFQNYRLVETLTALKNIQRPLLFRGYGFHQSNKLARELLEKFGLSEVQNHRPSELSGGQQQRVAIARTLALDPEIIIADEPTAALDKANAGIVHQFLSDQSRAGKTIILGTHDQDLARKADRVLTLRNGHLKAAGL